MNEKEAETLVNKAMRVILSCRTMVQLNYAVRFSSLAYEQLARETGLINRMGFVNRIERSIGYAQCQIKHVKPNERRI